MQEHMVDGGGPGPHMGQGMTGDMRSHMQQEMQEPWEAVTVAV